jgi:serine/threonine protein kinase
MPLSTGDKLGPYEILAPIGAGGMGDVYKARDTRLDRIVAIKVSKTEFSERFEREARAVAALNHPNICTLHDVGSNYLVMEYIGGTPLKGPLPLDQALKYAAQICDALDAAHKKGIVHRDLKPANILVTKSGIKLLDFGLAKIGQTVKPLDDATLTMALTGKNEILGTLYYMSPEQLQSQATGQEIDGRSDIFSFGLVLYEIVTGKRAFEGSSPASVIAAIMERPAPSITDVAPPALDRVLKRCLEKDPDNRWQSARDLKSALELVTADMETRASASVSELSGAARRPVRLPWAIAAVLTLTTAALAWVHFTAAPPSPEPVRFQILPPEKQIFSEFLAISPDGRKLAFLTLDINNRSILWVRPLDSVDAKRLSGPGENNVSSPFWSPDSRVIAYFADGKLKKIDSAIGDTQIICDAPGFRGASWSNKGVIAFGAAMGGSTGLWTVPETGGTPKAATAGSNGVRYNPSFLPDGEHFLYGDVKGNRDPAVYLGSISLPLDRQSTEPLLATPFQAEFAPFAPRGSRGHLLFVRDAALLAQPFDAADGRLSGEPAPVVNSVSNGETIGGPILGIAGFSVSENGVLAYRSGTGRAFRLTWLDRSGKPLGTPGGAAQFTEVQLSPDGRRLAGITGGDIWILDLERNIPTRFTFDGMGNRSPVWSPDGSKIAYATSTGASRAIWAKPISGGEPQMLFQSDQPAVPSDWTKDGQNLILTVSNKETGADVVRLPLTGARTPAPLVRTKFQEGQASVSPDGKWLLYVSLESGNNQTYVRRFPSGEGKWVISEGQGVEARWSADGHKIYYRHQGSIMEVDVKPGADFVPSTPKPVMDVSIVGAGGFDRNPAWTVNPDGSRFLGMVEQKSDAPDTINVILNWQSALKK